MYGMKRNGERFAERVDAREEEGRVIVRPVEILRGYRAISRRMHVSTDAVRDWVIAGAPICYEKETPLAEIAELWAWRMGRQRLAV